MPRPIKRIEIYLPLEYNDGRPIPKTKFTAVLLGLLERFGGVTSVQRDFPLQGLWKTALKTYQDRVVILTAMDFGQQSSFETMRYLERLKGQLKKKFDQLEILITVTDLLAI